jgi:hypothetical protein
MTFLERIWGPDLASQAMACATVANVASDVLFFNHDVGARTNDQNIIGRSQFVLKELREVWQSIEEYAIAGHQ